MQRGWVSPKTIKFTERHDAIAEDYKNGMRAAGISVKYKLSKTWVYHVIYCYGLAKRSPMTRELDPLNYARLQRYLKRRMNVKPESHRPVPGP